MGVRNLFHLHWVWRMTPESMITEKDGARDAGPPKRFLRDEEHGCIGPKEIVAKVRHDLNNALTGILGQTQLLLREELSERARERVVMIEALATRIKDVTAGLRDFPPSPKL